MKYTLQLYDVPFCPDSKQVIYVENEYDVKTNLFIQNNYDAICKYYGDLGYEFCYLPYVAERFAKDVALKYYIPYVTADKIQPLSSDYMLQFMKYPENRSKIGPSLILFDGVWKPGEQIDFKGVMLDYDELFLEIFLFALADIEDDSHSSKESVSDGGGSDIRFRIKSIKDDEEPEIRFSKKPVLKKEPSLEELSLEWDEDTHKLVDEMELVVEKLKLKGLSLHLLNQIMCRSEKVSRLRVTSDFRLFLLDYGNKEVVMRPIVKTLYILYLRHPEGIAFKDLSDYRMELQEIYFMLKSGGKSPSVIDKIKNSVLALTNPLDNSVNEKCATIRASFVKVIDPHLARNYTITGTRGGVRRIVLPRDKVVWE